MDPYNRYTYDYDYKEFQRQMRQPPPRQRFQQEYVYEYDEHLEDDYERYEEPTYNDDPRMQGGYMRMDDDEYRNPNERIEDALNFNMLGGGPPRAQDFGKPKMANQQPRQQRQLNTVSMPPISPAKKNKISEDQKQLDEEFEKLQKKRLAKRQKQPKSRLNRKKVEQKFTMFPRLKRKVRLDEAQRLRDHLLCMIFAHTLFIFLEIFLYDTQIFLMVSDMLYIWILYQAYMTLSSWALWLYIALMFLAPVTGVRILMNMGFGFNTFVLLLQLVICGYAGGFVTLLHVNIYNKAIATEEKRKKKLLQKNQDEDARQILQQLEKEPEEFQPPYMVKQQQSPLQKDIQQATERVSRQLGEPRTHRKQMSYGNQLGDELNFLSPQMARKSNQRQSHFGNEYATPNAIDVPVINYQEGMMKRVELERSNHFNYDYHEEDEAFGR